MRPFEPFVDGYWDVGNQLADHIRRRCLEAAAREAQEKAVLSSTKDFESRRERVRQAFLKALGGLPEKSGDLKAEVTGVIHGPGFRIEKVIFQSLPEFFVTANLYVPANVPLPGPAVLFLCGHSRDGKAYPVYQKVCRALAQAGFVVLAIDPVGQGERMQYVNPRTGKLDVEWGTYEHSHAGLQCTIAGFSIARYFINDAIRALDYLCSRSEVDSTRVGVTGNSGGGTQTSYLMLIDDRLKAAVPCTYITSREHYLLTGQPHDAEQNLFGALTEGINYDDFLTALAPKPVQLGAVASDFFTIEGALQSAERARKVYGLYGKPGHFRIVVAPGTHQYAALLRQEAVKWFRYHLMGTGGEPLNDVIAPSRLEHPDQFAPEEPETNDPVLTPLPEQELWCTESGQIVLDRPCGHTVFDLNRAAFEANLVSSKDSTNAELKNAVYRNRLPVSAWARCIASGQNGEFSWKKVFFFTEPDIVVTGIWVSTDKNARPWVVLLDHGTETLRKDAKIIKKLAKEKGRIFVFDVRGVGALSQRPINPYGVNDTFGTEFVLNYDAIMLKDSLFWMRAYDVTQALSYVEGVTSQVPALYASGWQGPIGLAAAAVWKDYGLSALEFDRLLEDVRCIIDERLHARDHRLEAFALAKSLNIKDVLAAYQGRAKVNSWVDGRGEVVRSESL